MFDKNPIEELEARLAEMQRELEKLKNPVAEEKKKANPFEKYKDELAIAQKSVINIFKQMLEDGEQAVSTVLSATAFKGSSNSGNSSSTINIKIVDDINEDGMAAALDIFTNPRRIAVLKLLISKELTPSEISQQTGLVGGQLYHHLSILENAGLIEKSSDKYRTKGEAQTLLCGLYAIVGGMDIAKG